MNSIIIHLLGQRFPQVLYLCLCLFIVEIFISRYSIHQEPSFFTHSLQIYCIGSLGLYPNHIGFELQIVTLQDVFEILNKCHL